jgi:large subunit ribosomal protein L35
MARTAGKSKTHKAISKRVKVTGTGKMLRRKQGKRHLLINKNRKRKRNLGKAALVSEADLPRFRKNLPFSH